MFGLISNVSVYLYGSYTSSYIYTNNCLDLKGRVHVIVQGFPGWHVMIATAGILEMIANQTAAVLMVHVLEENMEMALAYAKQVLIICKHCIMLFLVMTNNNIFTHFIERLIQQNQKFQSFHKILRPNTLV